MKRVSLKGQKRCVNARSIASSSLSPIPAKVVDLQSSRNVSLPTRISEGPKNRQTPREDHLPASFFENAIDHRTSCGGPDSTLVHINTVDHHAREERPVLQIRSNPPVAKDRNSQLSFLRAQPFSSPVCRSSQKQRITPRASSSLSRHRRPRKNPANAIDFRGSNHSLSEKARHSHWPLPWARMNFNADDPPVQKFSDVQITQAPDSFCPCVSRFEHKVFKCPFPDHLNLFINWEVERIVTGSYRYRTGSLQKVFAGYPFIDDEAYRNINYARPRIWDALHQEPRVLLKFLWRLTNAVLVHWDNRDLYWDDYNGQREAATLRGQAFTYSIVYTKLIEESNQQEIYRGKFQDDDVGFMKRIIVQLRNLVDEIDSEFEEPEEFDQVGLIGHIAASGPGPVMSGSYRQRRTEPGTRNQHPIDAMMEIMESRDRGPADQQISTGDTTEVKSDEEMQDSSHEVDLPYNDRGKRAEAQGMHTVFKDEKDSHHSASPTRSTC
ncbi:hypothetical protein JHW43_002852 [Diplocarpon mali]|nr:hypothetical protein JHW43_002852 [Diplocarpon mali]